MTRLLTDNVEVIAQSQEGVPKLRQVILDLAVRGKLVEQDSGDDPASLLLDQAAVQRRAFSSGGIARPVQGEGSQALPDGWAFATLRELARVRGGMTPAMSNSAYWGGEIPWVSPKDMHIGRISGSELRITARALEETSLELIPVNSILVVARSGILKRKLPIQVTAVPCTINQDLKAFTPFIASLVPYVELLLRGYESTILREDVKQGTTVQSLISNKLFDRLFPIPPLAEQGRILRRVDELMALCGQLSTSIAAAGRVQASLATSITSAAGADAEHSSSSAKSSSSSGPVALG